MFISPMLLHKTEQPFDSDDYITELKLDGIRLLYSVDLQGKVRLYTRHKNEVTSKFPELVALNSIPPGTVLDGELIVTNEEGKPDFEAVMSRFQSKRSHYCISYVVFDVLLHRGESTVSIPLLKRKELLAEIVETDTEILSKSQFVEGNGAAFFELTKAQLLEGIVLKKKDSKYEIGKRSHSWLKCINYQYADVLVTGYRKNEFGWLLSDYSGKPLGIMELGVSEHERKRGYQAKRLQESTDFVFIEPFETKVKFREYTKAGLLRLPSLA
ncbi:DNA ligase-1 [Bacillus mesophilus]|uniref:ATP-dependent DNA ligase n=1 Tax=Bacillus mesophilus TaxID=1808955 RepID=A0A6M0QFM7_9BACI|nr:ATP-dependent DNA ligase [Bacillus mesophilus]MBM7662783.1 DNA ligase-1 [Bacillus mesophilus]NEY74248.1 ATP-dependent DNA ligase [Bacillus mesophilus]